MYLQFHKTSFFPRLPQIARLLDCPAPIAIIVKETRVSENFVGSGVISLFIPALHALKLSTGPIRVTNGFG